MTRRRFGRFALAAAVVVVLVAGLLLAAVSARSSDRGQRPVLVMRWNFRVVTLPAADVVPVCRESWGAVLVTSARHGGEQWAAAEELRGKGVGISHITRCSRP